VLMADVRSVPPAPAATIPKSLTLYAGPLTHAGADDVSDRYCLRVPVLPAKRVATPDVPPYIISPLLDIGLVKPGAVLVITPVPVIGLGVTLMPVPAVMLTEPPPPPPELVVPVAGVLSGLLPLAVRSVDLVAPVLLDGKNVAISE